MIRLLADNNADGQVEALVRILVSGEWIAFWNYLNVATITFEDLGLQRHVGDAELWRICQREQVILVTSNRNSTDPDSLEITLRAENTFECLPVFTFANAKRINFDRSYAEAAAISLLDYLMRIEELRGTGRLFIP